LTVYLFGLNGMEHGSDLVTGRSDSKSSNEEGTTEEDDLVNKLV
jgi:hypothetical protein